MTRELNELIYVQCFGKLFCDFRSEYCNGYRVTIDGYFDGDFCANNDTEAIDIFKNHNYQSIRYNANTIY